MYGEKLNAYKTLMVKSQCRRPLGKPRRRFKDNIEKDLEKIGLEGVEFFHLTQYWNKLGAFLKMIKKHFGFRIMQGNF